MKTHLRVKDQNLKNQLKLNVKRYFRRFTLRQVLSDHSPNM